MKHIKKLQAKGLYDADRDDPFELFVSATNIRWCYYKETQRILGNTYGMLVLQDFEAVTPNILCRAIETVEGGGIVVLLLRTMSSLRQLYGLTMDVHSRFRTEAHSDVVGRFNERFLLSLANCPTCLVLDDELNVLPLSRHAKNIVPIVVPGGAAEENEAPSSKRSKSASTGFAMADEMLAAAGVTFGPSVTGSAAARNASAAGRALSPLEEELEELKASLAGTPLVGALTACTRTLDQARAVMSFAEAIGEKTLRNTVALTAGRGRGKSSALGLAIAAAVGHGYSNIFVTAPSPENLKTLFEFVFKGLEALSYREHADYEAVASTNPEWNGAIVRINVFRGHRQTVAFVAPEDADKLSQAELLVVDEAAAIPLPVVKRLLGPYLVFLASTINGYEGTGRALSLKLIQQLRSSAAPGATAAHSGLAGASTSGRLFREVSLREPIRYAAGDGVEAWLNELLCLDATDLPRLNVGGPGGGRLPAPSECELFCVDRDALFSGHRVSEAFLKRVWGLYVSSHYKNSPNDLQLLSDAPAHRLFVLLGPQSSQPSAGSSGDGPQLPDVLVVLQVCLEGRISRDSVRAQLARGARSSGDLIPWTVSQQFQDEGFPALSGARVVRIASHPDAARMGYGTRALELLAKFYEGSLASLPLDGEEDEEVAVDRGNRAAEARDEAAMDEDGATEGAESRLLTEKIKPRKTLPPLLVPAGDITRPERLHWVGTSYGLTAGLFAYWHRSGYLPVYLRQTANDVTSEHTMIMMRALSTAGVPGAPRAGWLTGFVADFARRFLSLLAAEFRTYELPLALSVADAACSVMGLSITSGGEQEGEEAAPAAKAGSSKHPRPAGEDEGAGASGRGGAGGELTRSALSVLFTPHDLGRLDAYSRNLVDYHMVLDLIPDVARLYFTSRLPAVHLPRLQAGILLAVGLQRADVDAVGAGLGVPGGQVLALFNKAVRKISTALNGVVERDAAATMDATAAERLAAAKSGRAAAVPAPAGAGDAARARPAAERDPAVAAMLADPSLARFAVPADGVFNAELSGIGARSTAHDRAGALGGGGQGVPATLSLPRPAAGGDKMGGGRGRDQPPPSAGGERERGRSHPDDVFGGAVEKMAGGAKKLKR